MDEKHKLALIKRSKLLNIKYPKKEDSEKISVIESIRIQETRKNITIRSI